MLFGLGVGIILTHLVTLSVRRGSHAAEAAAEDVPDGIDGMLDALESPGLVLDPSNTVVKFSPGAAAMGLVHQRALLHPALTELVEDVRRGSEPLVRRLVLPRGPFGSSAQDVVVRGARLGVRFVLLLVEDRSEALRLDEVRRDFVANISHELKTPIGAITLLSEALDSAADDPDAVRRFAARMSTEARRLSRITQEIIDLSRLQAADALKSPELVDIDHVVASAMDQSMVLATARRVRLARGGEKRTRVYGDEALLIVALHNLVTNAIQYSADGARVGIGVRRHEGLVEIAVTDQGIGIAAEDRDRVFERFYRVDPARSRNTGGSGLGLSIVKHVVQNHGGEVRLWTQPDRGSTFTIRIPEASEERAAALGLESK